MGAPVSGVQGYIPVNENAFSGSIGYSDRALEYVQKTIALSIFNLEKNRANQAMKLSPALAVFAMGYKNPELNIKTSKYSAIGKFRKYKNSAPVQVRVRADSSENIVKMEKYDSKYKVSPQADAKFSYFSPTLCSDTISFFKTQLEQLQSTASYTDFINDQVAMLSESTPDEIAKSALNETHTGKFGSIRGVIKTSGNIGTLAATTKNKQGDTFWKANSKTTATWYNTGSKDASDLLLTCDQYSKKGVVDIGLCNKAYYSNYREELKTKGSLDFTGFAKKLQELDYNFKLISVDGTPLIYDPNFILSDEDTGKAFYLNSEHFFPATVEKQVSILSPTGKKFAGKVWLGDVTPARLVDNLSEQYFQALNAYFHWITTQPNTCGIHIVSSYATS